MQKSSLPAVEDWPDWKLPCQSSQGVWPLCDNLKHRDWSAWAYVDFWRYLKMDCAMMCLVMKDLFCIMDGILGKHVVSVTNKARTRCNARGQNVYHVCQFPPGVLKCKTWIQRFTLDKVVKYAHRTSDLDQGGLPLAELERTGVVDYLQCD